MSQQSSDQLSRFRWTVVVLLASAAGLCAAAIRRYNAQLPATLRRSNAVHRQQALRDPRSALDWRVPTADAPFGTIIFRKNNDETMAIDLATTRLPSVDALRDLYGNGYKAILRMSQRLAYKLVIAGSMQLAHEPEGRAVLRDHGFHELATAMFNEDGDGMIQASDIVLRVMHLDTLDQQQVQDIVESLRTRNIWTEMSSSVDDDRDPADTEEDWSTERAEPGQGLRGLLYYIAENDAQRKAYEHRGIRCEECGDIPIHGVRWHCLNCPDYDLCSTCEAHTRHPKTHVFAKIKIPVPVLSQPTKEVKLWYPGDPRRIHPFLCVNLKKQLCQEYDYEEPQLDAMYDQFTCLANVPWELDPRKVRAAIDRRAFNKALTSDRWPAGLATNAIYDRMFAFYDSDNNSLIGFTEFVDGMAYLRGPKRFASLKRSIQGYDLDGDGYVNRADFLRLLHAKHIIQKQLISDQVEYQESERVQASMDILRSSQPISSNFTEEQIPPGHTRRPRGKQPDSFGDLLPLPTTRAVLRDEDPFVRDRPVREQLRGMLSRFEEHIATQATGPRRGDDSPRPESSEEHRGEMVLAPLPDEEEDSLDPYMQDMLWQVEEGGFNELLDPLFKAREEEDAEVVNTRGERVRWAVEIDDAIEAEARSRARLMAATTAVQQPGCASNPDDTGGTASEVPQRRNQSAPRPESAIPGRATHGLTPRNEQREDATDDELSTNGERYDRPRRQAGMTTDVVSTDWQSLERREARIADAPLGDLLDSLGADLRNDEEIAASNARVAHSDSSTIWNGVPADRATSPLKTATTSDDSADPTLPQHRPTTILLENTSPNKLSDPVKTADEEAPSKARLNQLAHLNDLEREMKKRGGPGRLAYDEIEHIVVDAGRSELRGMVKSWLEWASF